MADSAETGAPVNHWTTSFLLEDSEHVRCVWCRGVIEIGMSIWSPETRNFEPMGEPFTMETYKACCLGHLLECTEYPRDSA